MKANEIPEKIYLIRNFPNSTALNTTNDNHGNFLNEWYLSREKDADIEYTRTDAFIEKAEKFIYSALNDGIMDTANIEDFMRLFKKYMKGE